ncbi:cytochrome P450 [Reyranella sp. CPCC 100927]|uniref:cytochrome P450 n=1 Tax=Reyranella sp. CPCC 100927 TaxID=2599616 RepID=UPI0011B363AB|nr:cytochrome P450 [Reyranella sp. CPCC 100927]TWT13072.1 cytochrome P450 [Reyranella sp. CPCC 100927]
MLAFKYYDKIRTAQGQSAPPTLHSTFDLKKTLGSSGRIKRAMSGLTRHVMLAVFWVFRAVWPTPRFGRLVLVTRHADVMAVLNNAGDFEVPYGPEMKELAGGTNFVLGMEGPEHDRQHDIIQRVVLPPDAIAVRTHTRHLTNALLAGSGGRIDVMHDLITRVAAETCCRYFGLDIEEPEAFADRAMSVSNLLFADPFGKDKNRQLALDGAARIRALIDRAIARAKMQPRPGTLVDRLVELQSNPGIGPAPTDSEIRAILVGLATGFIPTNTLAAGKVLQELLRRPDAMRLATEKARAGDRAGLKKILFEAARLNPALAPGQFRYAVRDTTIGTKRVAAGSVLMVATLSALRDRRQFTSPGRFWPDRPTQPGLMFGTGVHECLGKHLATEQIVEIFEVLLAQPGLRTAPDRDGALVWVGPFPRRLDMVFDTATPATQTMVQVCAPVPASAKVQLEGQIEALGNPARADVAQTLKDTGIVHFASLSVVDAGDGAHYLLLELNVDGPREAALRKVATHAEAWLKPLFQHVQSGDSLALDDQLIRHALDLHTWPWGAIGLNFNGTPDTPVSDIARQDALATFARDALKYYQKKHFEFGSRPIRVVDHVRKLIQQDDDYVRQAASDEPLRDLLDRGAGFADFLIRPSGRQLAMSEWKERNAGGAFKSFATTRSALRLGLLLFALIVALSVVVDWSLGPGLAFQHFFTNTVTGIGRFLLAVVGGVVATSLLLAAVAAAFIGLLRWHEKRDEPDDRNPEQAYLQTLTARENPPGYAQNHITAVTHLKPGWFRKLTTAVAMWSIGVLVAHKYRPGFVVNIGTIHYAKWFRLPGSERLIFLANFDGSWESYLEDFITKAHQGQSAAWSNGVGFPRTRFLTRDGAQDGDRFKRWVRRQQVPTQFWYSRFPELTTDQIRLNALIHDGLMRARTDTAAQAWLDCFGSMPRPDYAIETMEVQSLVFRALGDLPYTACVVLRLPDQPQHCTSWLDGLMPPNGKPASAEGIEPITFGDRPTVKDKNGFRVATFVAFSAAGLARFGVPDVGLKTFPGPFTAGMISRSRILGDVGSSAPETWRWADGQPVDGRPTADAVLFLYADSAEKRDRALEAHRRRMLKQGGAFLDVVLTQPVSANGKEKSKEYEHFGYRDGISQPIIRGTQRFAKGALENDIVAPGELLLGYRNNQNYFPPSVVVPPESDLGNLLPADNATVTSRFPRFRAWPTAVPRDFGRNGTFIAVRQLVQDVEGFHAFTESKAQELRKYPNLKALIGGEITADWVAAKMMGRWRDGTPLIERPGPEEPKRKGKRSSGAEPTNDFKFGEEDPQGFFCPFGAHIRRANPRDSLQPGDPKQLIITNRHRLLRRGRSYVKPAADNQPEEKGLMFVGLCADLERQFEFVQQSWIASPSFHGLNSEPDPITASACPGQRVFTIPTPAGAVVLDNMQSFVTVRAGGYFFLPSHAALRFLTELHHGKSLPQPRASEAEVDKPVAPSPA